MPFDKEALHAAQQIPNVKETMKTMNFSIKLNKLDASKSYFNLKSTDWKGKTDDKKTIPAQKDKVQTNTNGNAAKSYKNKAKKNKSKVKENPKKHTKTDELSTLEILLIMIAAFFFLLCCLPTLFFITFFYKKKIPLSSLWKMKWFSTPTPAIEDPQQPWLYMANDENGIVDPNMEIPSNVEPPQNNDNPKTEMFES